MAWDVRGERIIPHSIPDRSRASFMRGGGDVVRHGLVGAPLSSWDSAEEGESLFAEGSEGRGGSDAVDLRGHAVAFRVGVFCCGGVFGVVVVSRTALIAGLLFFFLIFF